MRKRGGKRYSSAKAHAGKSAQNFSKSKLSRRTVLQQSSPLCLNSAASNFNHPLSSPHHPLHHPLSSPCHPFSSPLTLVVPVTTDGNSDNRQWQAMTAPMVMTVMA